MASHFFYRISTIYYALFLENDRSSFGYIKHSDGRSSIHHSYEILLSVGTIGSAGKTCVSANEAPDKDTRNVISATAIVCFDS